MIRKTPGVYIQRVRGTGIEIPDLESALPVFIGYTQQAEDLEGNDLHFQPVQIHSLNEFVLIFGGAFVPKEIRLSVNLEKDLKVEKVEVVKPYFLYDCIQHFYDNGGEICWIVSTGDYEQIPNPRVRLADFQKGLLPLEKFEEPTLLLAPDAVSLRNANGSPDLTFYQEMMAQCANLQDRFCIFDLPKGDVAQGPLEDPVEDFRDRIGTRNLTYGAVYYPWIYTNYEQQYSFGQLKLLDSKTNSIIPIAEISGQAQDAKLINTVRKRLKEFRSLPVDSTLAELNEALAALREAETILFTRHPFFQKANDKIDLALKKLPVSGTIAGIITATDHSRGVWKAPANVAIESVIGPVVDIDNRDQERLNVHSSGKSVNAIRAFATKGTLVWGARTLAGNDLEWRYIPVRRLFIFLEESIKKALEPFVFVENVQNTWSAVEGSIYNFLEEFWEKGALTGATPNEAFFVSVGLNKTMTAQDILEGRMIVEIGLAASRPLEFINLRFVCNMEA